MGARLWITQIRQVRSGADQTPNRVGHCIDGTGELASSEPFLLHFSSEERLHKSSEIVAGGLGRIGSDWIDERFPKCHGCFEAFNRFEGKTSAQNAM